MAHVESVKGSVRYAGYVRVQIGYKGDVRAVLLGQYSREHGVARKGGRHISLLSLTVMKFVRNVLTLCGKGMYT